MIQLTVALPPEGVEALGWVAETILSDRLGLPIRLVSQPGADVVISADGRTLTLASHFPDLEADRSQWSEQLPKEPLPHWDATAHLPEVDLEEPVPVLYGTGTVTSGDRDIRCGLDIFGAIFFMLSRFDEVALPDRDAHDRFPATASLAWKAGFLYRPIVDEYVEVLWAMMKRLWPGLERKRRQGEIRVSCDVDRPFDPIGTNPIALLKVLRHDLLLNGRVRRAASRTVNVLAHQWGTRRFDPYFTFDWYFKTCDRLGRSAHFYFVAENTARSLDPTYGIEDAEILSLMDRIHQHGHAIGMHGSYNSFLSASRMVREKDRLGQALELAGVDDPVLGNRQHYLRWDSAQTPDHLDAAGFTYDTTGGYADRPGFRYGTAVPFRMWSWRLLSSLGIEQRPLVLMECSVTSDKYLGLGKGQEAYDCMAALRRRALRYGGDFTLLWHNSELMTHEDRELFVAMAGNQ